MNLSEILSLTSIIISVVLAVGIFVLAKWLDNHSEKRQKKYSTLTWTNACFIAIDDAIGNKARIEQQFYQGLQKFDYETISADCQLEKSVFMILNQYTSVGVAAQESLIELSILEQLRGGTLNRTWKQYMEYIEEYRNNTGIKTAWSDFEWLVKNIG